MLYSMLPAAMPALRSAKRFYARLTYLRVAAVCDMKLLLMSQSGTRLSQERMR